MQANSQTENQTTSNDGVQQSRPDVDNQDKDTLSTWDFEYLEISISALTNSSGPGFRIALRDWLAVDGSRNAKTVGEATIMYLEWLTATLKNITTPTSKAHVNKSKPYILVLFPGEDRQAELQSYGTAKEAYAAAKRWKHPHDVMKKLPDGTLTTEF